MSFIGASGGGVPVYRVRCTASAGGSRRVQLQRSADEEQRAFDRWGTDHHPEALRGLTSLAQGITDVGAEAAGVGGGDEQAVLQSGGLAEEVDEAFGAAGHVEPSKFGSAGVPAIGCASRITEVVRSM